jgi:hypothetical protein
MRVEPSRMEKKSGLVWVGRGRSQGNGMRLVVVRRGQDVGALPLAGAARVLGRHHAHEVLGSLVAGVAPAQAEVDAALRTERCY